MDYSRVNVTWNSINEVTGYEVWRSTSSGGTYAKIATLSETTISNTGLTTNTTYYYKVRGYCVDGDATYYGLFSDMDTTQVAGSIPTSFRIGRQHSNGWTSCEEADQ